MSTDTIKQMTKHREERHSSAGNQWYICYGILSNGFCFGQHVCSRPGFAPSDLYFGRTERMAAIESLFGVRFAQGQYKLYVVESAADVPEWWNAHEKLQDSLKSKYEEYKTLIAAHRR